MIEIIPVGGYSEIGRNCTIVKWKDEAVMLDFGLNMEEYIKLTEEIDDVKYRISQGALIREQAVPDLEIVKDELKYVKAVCVSHAHLDHVGAIPFFTNKLKMPVHGTKFTIAVLGALLRDKSRGKSKEINMNLVAHMENCKFRISENLEVQFIHVTHSTPHTVVIVVHTPEGKVVYANDFKLDDTPLLGKKPNYKAMKELKDVKVLIMDSLYAQSPKKTPSEKIAREMLREILLRDSYKGKNIVVTTFSSHIARIKTIVDLTRSMGRKPVFLGRSLSKYLDAAKESKIIDFDKKADFVRFGSKVEKYFRQHKKTNNKIFIVTGHQGEPNAILSRIANGKFFPFQEDDIVIFSCKIIPIEESYLNREKLENELKKKKVRIFTDVHVSGHAAREDHREFIKIIKPQNIIPTHGVPDMLLALKELAMEMNYDGSKIHILRNNSRIHI